MRAMITVDWNERLARVEIREIRDTFPAPNPEHLRSGSHVTAYELGVVPAEVVEEEGLKANGMDANEAESGEMGIQG